MQTADDPGGGAAEQRGGPGPPLDCAVDRTASLGRPTDQPRLQHHRHRPEGSQGPAGAPHPFPGRPQQSSAGPVTCCSTTECFQIYFLVPRSTRSNRCRSCTVRRCWPRCGAGPGSGSGPTSSAGMSSTLTFTPSSGNSSKHFQDTRSGCILHTGFTWFTYNIDHVLRRLFHQQNSHRL